MIWLMSDLHNEFQVEGLLHYEETATADDLLILLGDIGLDFPERQSYREFEQAFRALTKPIAFLDGNHENYDYLSAFPEESWNGGTVHRLSPTMVHLQRGNIYTIQGKTCFVMGGWVSSAVWKMRGLWRPGEAPDAVELQRGREALAAQGNRVDYLLTHNYNPHPGGTGQESVLRQYCRELDETVTFRRWYFGHCHRDLVVDETHRAVYHTLVPLE